ncbi:MAG: single-stranded-DNA-specific exonuclease RecJ, partial [Pseudomonadota bacterium]
MSSPIRETLFNVQRSLTGRFWTLGAHDDQLVRKLASVVGGDDLLGRLLAGRAVEPDDVKAYLNPTLRQTFPDPSSFADMDKAAGLVMDAIEAKKPVTVFADYDVDGGTSSALLARYFRAWGQDLGLYVPDRLKEGYGPSPEAFQAIKANGTELVI